jgi:galactose mutarotase-like enzyme
MSERFLASQDGFEVIGLRNEFVEIVVVPELGGKIISLKDQRTARQWMWHPGDCLKLFRNSVGDAFEKSTMVGADECLPSVAGCRVNGHTIPDHGEVWRRGCEEYEGWEGFEGDKSEIALRCSLKSLPLDFSRAIRLRGNVVEMRYELLNRSDSAQDYLWAFHPLMRIEQGDRIELDASTARVETTNWKGDQRGDAWAWPSPRAGIDLGNMELGSEPAYAKLFIETGGRDKAAIVNSLRGERITFEFDSPHISAIGVWLTRGGWNGYHHVAIEPTNAAADSLADAITENRCKPIAPREPVEWMFRISVG